MDYANLTELVFVSFFGLSLALFTCALSIRFVLKPFFSQFIEAYRERNAGRLSAQAREQIEYLQGRLLEMETELEDARAARDFDLQLRAGAPLAQK